MKKINPANYGLFINDDFFDDDVINMDIIEDGEDVKISKLNEEQAKMILALAMRRLKKIEKLHKEIRFSLI